MVQTEKEQATENVTAKDDAQNEGENEIQHQQNVPTEPITRQPPTYLKEYYCHSTTNNPTYKSLVPSPKRSIAYPISDYLD